MAATVPNHVPAYTLGTLSIALGLNAIFRPAAEYPRFGLPLEYGGGPTTPHRVSDVSPLMYLKGIREISYGLLLIGLQSQGQETAVTTLAAVMAWVGLADGVVVWCCGGAERRQQAWGHWGTFLGLGVWAWYRVSY
ncbi:hypothetical protein ASPACDRAFT_1859122 [Aspergillus aculeatus ATCC 16872]|uniref:Uncharacterized protein n=1 Tax=Aspergillus aculeatus (strain ATCC 16872 / CBS 172.66 / WB 5094) TaxID=690307 RepID=A0A1L9WJV5_ASPA1|nr:uncharacterized protein ASPACDRAFT_1859122 [Aspergillus aculeatus ATCC 16872]OJJ96436.1 hypothetical protein ASPACDRAFT_1859122 [Aspergillus aculeatus ATCC 16872]